MIVPVCPFDHGPGKEFYATASESMPKHLQEEHECLMLYCDNLGSYWAVNMHSKKKERKIHCKQYVPEKFRGTAAVSTVGADAVVTAKKPLSPLPTIPQLPLSGIPPWALPGEHYNYHAISVV